MRLLVCMVGAADHGAYGGMLETDLVGVLFKLPELIRMNVAQYGQMPVGGLQVLSQRQHVNVVCTHILQQLGNFLISFSQPDHDAGFCRQRGETCLEILEPYRDW